MASRKRNLTSDQMLDKAGELARKDPAKTRGMIDKLQGAVDRATKGRFTGAIDKGGDFVEDRLGLPSDPTTQTPSSPSSPQGPTSSPSPGQPPRQDGRE